MTFNSEFPQTLLNEVLSITAQESATARRGGRGFHVLNEVLSITAQEFPTSQDGMTLDWTSPMKS